MLKRVVNRLAVGFAAVMALALILGFTGTAGAQQINTILKYDYTNPVWNNWDTIWGSNMPFGSQTVVRLTYPALYVGGGFGGAENDITAASPNQATWWYSSATQVNAFLFAPTYPGSVYPQAGCVAELQGTVCDTVRVCANGMCTNTYTFTLAGLP